MNARMSGRSGFRGLQILIAGLSVGLALIQTGPALAADPAQPTNYGCLPPPVADERLMLVPFENGLKDQSASIGEMAADTLQMSLLKPKQRPFRVIGRKQVKAMLAELAFSESSLSDPAKALQLGKLLSANVMLTGSVSAGKIHTSEVSNLQPTEYTWATVQVSATLTQIETGEVLFASKAEGSSKPYPTWQGESFTSIILEAVEAASTTLAKELVETKMPTQPLPPPRSLSPAIAPITKPPTKPATQPPGQTPPKLPAEPGSKPGVNSGSKPPARPSARSSAPAKSPAGSRPSETETGPRRLAHHQGPKAETGAQG